jgi:hypothetical protein
MTENQTPAGTGYTNEAGKNVLILALADTAHCTAWSERLQRQCPGSPVRGSDPPLCSGHLGRGIGADPSRLGAKGHRVKNENAAERRAAEDLRRRGIASALRSRVHEHRDALLDALLAPVLDDSLSPTVRQRAALEVWSRAFGRPGTAESPAEGQEVAELSLEQLANLWRGADSAPRGLPAEAE